MEIDKKYFYIAFGAIVLMASMVFSGNLFQSPTGAAVYQGKCVLIVDDGFQKTTREIGLNGQTAFEILNENFDIRFDEYEGMGKMITGIKTNGWVESDSNNYWLFFVNEELADVSSDNYYVSEGDQVIFTYLNSQQAMRYFS